MRALIVLDAQLVDLAAFAVAVQTIGIGGEANPLMGALWAHGGLLSVAVLKVSGALILAAMTPHIGRWWLVPAIVGLAGAATGAWAIL